MYKWQVQIAINLRYEGPSDVGRTCIWTSIKTSYDIWWLSLAPWCCQRIYVFLFQRRTLEFLIPDPTTVLLQACQVSGGVRHRVTW